MPNKTIYLNTINNFEKTIGFSFVDKDGIAKKLQEAWNKDETQAKVNYLATYGEVFFGVLKTYGDSLLSKSLSERAQKMADFKNCLLKTDKALKVCAMALIPELRENEDVLSNMTFGAMDSKKIKDEFIDVRKKYLDIQESEKIVKNRGMKAYDKYKAEWAQTPTRKIVETVRDEKLLASMSKEDKIDYALAIEYYRETAIEEARQGKVNPLLDGRGIDLLADALEDWKGVLGFEKGKSITDGVANIYYEYATKMQENEWVDSEIESAIKEYDKTKNPAKSEIAYYKALDKKTAKLKTLKETTVPNAGYTDNTAEILGDFFLQAETPEEIKQMEDNPMQKERAFLEEKVTDFNNKYSLRINKDKLRTSVEQLSVYMIRAREEKEQFLSKDNVVVVENGEEKCYKAKEYFKDEIEKVNKEYEEKLAQLEQQRKDAKTELDNATMENPSQIPAKTTKEREKIKENAEKAYHDKTAELDKAILETKNKLQEELSVFEGGVVIEKNGTEVRKYKSSQYYETHETKKEQYAYGEYQKMYSRVYIDACKNLKEQDYLRGRVTHLDEVAEDVDKLFKSAMYISKVYDNEKNVEVIQKCSYGGFSAEKLASFVTNTKGDSWAMDQTSEKAWEKQITRARQILSQWTNEKTLNPKVDIVNKITSTLDKQLALYKDGKITRKEMMDYTLAADSHCSNTFPTRGKRLGNSSQYRREQKALKKCFEVLGIKEKDSWRTIMGQEYTRISKYMSKDEAFKSIGKTMTRSPAFKEEKEALRQKHQAVREKILSEKKTSLEQLKAKDKEPIYIAEIDERKAILNAKPRVKPIVPPTVTQRKKQLNA